MFPVYNSQPFHSSQLQNNGIAPSPPLQIMGNPGSFLPNPIQNQPQMAIPNNPNAQFGSGQIFPFQGANSLNNAMGMNQMGNVNSQTKGQFLPQNFVNPPQFLNQNVGFGGLPNGQWNFPNPMHNANQFLQMQMAMPMQMPGFGQVVPGNVPMYPNQVSNGMGPQNPSFVPNQVSQGMGPQNPAFSMNAHLGQQPMHGNLPKQMPNMNQQLQGQPPPMNSFGSVQPPQNQNFNAPASATSQVNPGRVSGNNRSQGNWKNSHSNKFTRNQKHGAESMNSQFGNADLSFHNKGPGKGNHRGREKILPNSVKPVEKKRPLAVTYSEQEIRQWREQRRKSYPSKANVEKKSTEKLADPEDGTSAAKLRRQQLKEVLAKQAELGCEVAEIPSCYLSDSEKQVDGREQKRPPSRKERFQNKFNKKGRFNQNDRFSKKQRYGNPDSSDNFDQKNCSAEQVDVSRESITQVTKSAREPTLLQKLLSADIKRDKRHLLQVFRFMVMNSFFKDHPEKPLRFPQVVVKELDSEIIEEKYAAMDTTMENSSNEYDESNFADVTDAVGES